MRGNSGQMADDAFRSRLAEIPLFVPEGELLDARGSFLRARLPAVPIGALCEIIDRATDARIEAEVIGFSSGSVVLAPLGGLEGISLNARIVPTGRFRTIRVGGSLIGRIVDGWARPIDPLGPLGSDLAEVRVSGDPPGPMSRQKVNAPMPVGLRAIDGLLTCGRGQRVGIFGEPGAGKSTLLGSLVRNANADLCVVGLIGERGREVKEFIEDILGEAGLGRSVVVVATSEQSPVDREAAALSATRIAEHFRDEGKDVLLVIDSLTRYARALREIGLAAGEVPTRRGFPSSVFASLPRLLERSGNGATGSITAFYTVLVEGDGFGDPVSEEVRSILDGHIVLSSELAAKNHYPAIDILRSKSRVAGMVTTDHHQAAAGEFRTLFAKLAEIEFLHQVGEYQRGSDITADRAVDARDAMTGFLQQSVGEVNTFDETLALLTEVAQ
ncbi:MAG: FliI/YscN family ATPase [Pseudomonadota bacterium]